MRSVLPASDKRRQGDEGPVISSFEVASPSLLISDVQVFRVLALRGIFSTVESQMEITRTVERGSRWWIRGSTEVVEWRHWEDERDEGNAEERKEKDQNLVGRGKSEKRFYRDSRWWWWRIPEVQATRNPGIYSCFVYSRFRSKDGWTGITVIINLQRMIYEPFNVQYQVSSRTINLQREKNRDFFQIIYRRNSLQ